MKIGDLIITKNRGLTLYADDPFDHQYGLILKKNKDATYSVNFKIKTHRSWYVFFSAWMKCIIIWENEMEVVSTCK